MKLALALALASCAACAEHRSITLQLGPDDATLTAGFTCRADTGDLLLEQTRRDKAYRFQLVIDTVELGATFPGCRGEEVFAACDNKVCSRISRFCMSVAVDQADFGNPAAVLASLHAQLGHPDLLTDAPRDPVVIRATATTQSCAELIPSNAPYPKLDPDKAVGCAYSCPVVLEELSGSLGLALDTLDSHCAAAVRACARFGS